MMYLCIFYFVNFFFQAEQTKLRITSQTIRRGYKLFKFGECGSCLCISCSTVGEPACRSIATAAEEKIVAAVFA